MKSLYGMYLEEREDKQIVETDKGFATYMLLPNKECYLQDLYVKPEYRKSGYATEMADTIVEIAKENGCKTLIGSVCSSDKNATRNMKVLLAYGMQIYKTTDIMIFLKKKIAEDN